MDDGESVQPRMLVCFGWMPSSASEAQLSSPMIRVRSLSRDYKELAILSNQGAVVLSENDSGSG
jgi:hypothetical protein